MVQEDFLEPRNELGLQIVPCTRCGQVAPRNEMALISSEALDFATELDQVELCLDCQSALGVNGVSPTV